MNRELGLISILISWLAIAYLLYKWRGTKDMSMSMHAASAKSAYIFFTAIELITGALLYIFFVTWFKNAYSLPDQFVLLVSITIGSIYLAALIPDSQGYRRVFHRIFAYTFAVMLFVLTTFIVTTANLSSAAQIIGWISFTYMLTGICLILFVRRWSMKYFLFFQVPYVIGFQLFILAATYLK